MALFTLQLSFPPSRSPFTNPTQLLAISLIPRQLLDKGSSPIVSCPSTRILRGCMSLHHTPISFVSLLSAHAIYPRRLYDEYELSFLIYYVAYCTNDRSAIHLIAGRCCPPLHEVDQICHSPARVRSPLLPPSCQGPTSRQVLRRL